MLAFALRAILGRFGVVGLLVGYILGHGAPASKGRARPSESIRDASLAFG
jgi:hypothetical protein